MNSIRVFLVAVILAVITLFYFIAALRGYQSSMLEADRLFDKQLLDTARLIANLHTEDTAGNLGHDASMAFQVWRGEQLLASSRNAPETAISTARLAWRATPGRVAQRSAARKATAIIARPSSW